MNEVADFQGVLGTIKGLLYFLEHLVIPKMTRIRDFITFPHNLLFKFWYIWDHNPSTCPFLPCSVMHLQN